MDTTKSNKQYLYLNGRMDYEMINSFLNFYNSLSSETNEVIIYLNSEGGLYDCMQILLGIINYSKVKITCILRHNYDSPLITNAYMFIG